MFWGLRFGVCVLGFGGQVPFVQAVRVWQGIYSDRRWTIK